MGAGVGRPKVPAWLAFLFHDESATMNRKETLWAASMLAPLYSIRSLPSLAAVSKEIIVTPKTNSSDIIPSDMQLIFIYGGQLTATVLDLGTVTFTVERTRRLARKFSLTKQEASLANRLRTYAVDCEHVTEEVMLCRRYGVAPGMSTYLLRFVASKIRAHEVVVKSLIVTNVRIQVKLKAIALPPIVPSHPKGTTWGRFNSLVPMTPGRRTSVSPSNASLPPVRSGDPGHVPITDDCATILHRSPYFAGIHHADLRALADMGTISIVQEDAVVMHEKEDGGHEMFVVLAGDLRVCVRDPDTKVLKPVATLQSGSCMGEMTLLLRGPRTASVTAITKCMLVSIERSALMGFLRRQPNVEANLKRVLIDRLLQNAIETRVVPVFDAIHYSDLLQLAPHCFIEDHVARGTLLWPDTSERKTFRILLSGSFEVMTETAAGPTGVIKQSGCIGELVPGVDHLPPNTSVTTTSECTFLSLFPDTSLTHISPLAIAEAAIRWSQANCTVEQVLHHPDARQFYMRYLSSEFSEENLEFVIAVHAFKTSTTASWQDANAIVAEYIVETAPKQVNVEAKMREEVVAMLVHADEASALHIFDRAVDEITTLMRKDSFPRFKKTTFFRDMLAAFPLHDHTQHEAAPASSSPAPDTSQDDARTPSEIGKRFKHVLDQVFAHRETRRELNRVQGMSKHTLGRARRSTAASASWMGVTWSKLSHKAKQDLWGSSLLSPLFVDDDLDTLSSLSVGHTILPNFPLINHKAKVALCYEGDVSVVIPKIGTVIFKIGPQKQFLGLKRMNTAGFSFSKALHRSILEHSNDDHFVVDTEEMLVSVYSSDDKLQLAKEYLVRFVVSKMNGNEVIIKSYRAVSMQVLKRSKVVSLERHHAKHDTNNKNAGVYYLLNNVLNADSLTLLRSVSFFADLSNEKLVRLADLSTISVLAPDVVIFKENDEEGSEMFIILAGSLTVSVASKVEGEPPLVLATLQAGSCFGEMALMTRVPRAATVTVQDNAMLLSIERKAFLDFLSDNQEVKKKLTHLLQERLMKKVLSSNIVPFFAAIDYARIMTLSERFFIEDRFISGDVIATPETYDLKFSIVICGSVDVVVENHTDDGASATSSSSTTLGPGSYFGRFGLLSETKSSRRRRSSVVARTKCVLFSCSKEQIEAVIGTSPVETAEMFIRWLREKCELQNVMAHPTARSFLVEFCTAEFSDENVLFLLDVERFTSLTTTTDHRDAARHIVETYIQANAPKQVNIDHRMREAIEAHYAKSMSSSAVDLKEARDTIDMSNAMFDAAREEITRLVTKDTFPRFKRAPQFQTMLNTFGTYTHARHISLQDAYRQFKENIVLSPRNGNNGDLFFKFVKILETVNKHKNRRATMFREANGGGGGTKVAIER
ncbi:unnamed protein product [Aphanomyces euteiches]